MAVEEIGIGLGQTVHEMPGRDRVGLEGRRVERPLARPIPDGEQRPPGRERGERDRVIHERLVEDDDVGHDLAE